MFDHPARRLAPPWDECSKCRHPIEGNGANLCHVGETRRPAIALSRSDAPMFNRTVLVTAQALDSLVWAPTLDNRERAHAIAEALLKAGLIASRPRTVKPRRTPAA